MGVANKQSLAGHAFHIHQFNTCCIVLADPSTGRAPVGLERPGFQFQSSHWPIK